MREGRGDEQSEYGQYKGAWKADTKTGYGEERTLVGTIFEGTWDKNRKHGRGVRRMIFGTVDEQVGVVNMKVSPSNYLIAGNFRGAKFSWLNTGARIFYPRMKRPYLPLPAVQGNHKPQTD